MLQFLGQPSLLCVLGTYLLIRLKEAAEEGVNEGTNFRAKTVTAMEFGVDPGTSESSEHNSFTVHNMANHLTLFVLPGASGNTEDIALYSV